MRTSADQVGNKSRAQQRQARAIPLGRVDPSQALGRAQRWVYATEFFLYRAAARVLRLLPSPLAHGLGVALGWLLFDLGERRRIALANAAIAYPDLPEPERRSMVGAAARNLGQNLVDMLRAEAWSEEGFRARVDFEGCKIVESALEQGRGVLILLGHVGNFELAMRAAPLFGLDLLVVSRALHNPYVEAHLATERGRTGSALIPHRQATSGIFRALRRGCAVAILNDQYTRRSHGVLAPLFGVRCWTSPGIATLSLRSGAPIIPCYIFRDGPDHHTLRFLSPLEPPTQGDLRSRVQALTERTNAALEEIIRAHPEEWMWTHRRFRHSPELEEDPYR